MSTKDFNGVSLFDGNTLNVTTDSEGNTFGMVGINLSNTSYTTATKDDITSLSGAQTALTDVKVAISPWPPTARTLVPTKRACRITATSSPR